MLRLEKYIDVKSEYLARKYACEADEGGDMLRCGHPQGPLKCRQMIACGACPYGEVLEFDAAA